MENEEVQVNTESGPVESAALDYLLSDEAVSSQRQTASDIISRAEAKTETGQRAAEAGRAAAGSRIEGGFGRDLSSMQRAAGTTRTAFAQSSAFGTSTAQFKLMDETINRNLNDLKQRKEDALLQADASYAAQMDSLMAQELEFRTQANQQMFSNMLGIAGIGQQQQSFRLQERSQQFQQDQAISSIALEFGLEAVDGESLEDVISRAAPRADEARRLQLAQMRSQINAANASLREANARMARNESLDAMDSGDLADLVMRGMLDAETALKHGAEPGSIVSAHTDMAEGMAGEDIRAMLMEGNSIDDIIDTVRNDNPDVSRIRLLEMSKELEKKVKVGDIQKPISFAQRVGAGAKTSFEYGGVVPGLGHLAGFGVGMAGLDPSKEQVQKFTGEFKTGFKAGFEG